MTELPLWIRAILGDPDLSAAATAGYLAEILAQVHPVEAQFARARADAAEASREIRPGEAPSN